MFKHIIRDETCRELDTARKNLGIFSIQDFPLQEKE